jgi:hypothetical protein
MSKILLFSICIALSVVIIDLSSDNKVHGNSSGSPNGYTGSPLEFGGRTCGTNGGCHGGGSTFQPNMISTDIPSSGYIPGQTYQITATVVFAGRTKFGFQLSPQRANGNTAGTMIANSSVQLTGSQRYATHNSSSNTGSGSRSWTFNWTAPATGLGPVTFYAAFNAANNNNSTSGDIIFNSSLVVNEASPTLDIIVNGESEICEGETVTLTSTIATGNQWSLNGIPINGATGSTYIASTGGVYSVSNGNQSAQVTILVNSVPPIPVIISSNSENLLCNGASLTLSANSQDVLQWSNGVIAPSITVSQQGSYTVTATNNCGSTTSAPVVVSTGSTPAQPSITVNGPTDFCAGSATTILQSSTSDGALLTWQPGNNTGNTFIPSASGNYTVTASNACGSSTSLPVSINILTVPAAPVISANGPSTICNGTILTLSASPSENTIWQPVNQSGVSIQTGTAGTYIATNTNTCGSVSSEPFVLEVTNEPVQPQIIGNIILENYCEGESVTLSVAAAPGDSVVWAPFFSNNTSITATQTGNYTVEIFNLCGSAISTPLGIVFVDIPETPELSFDGINLSVNPANATSYDWFLNNNIIFGANGPTYQPLENGIYKVRAINAIDRPCFSEMSNELNVILNSINNPFQQNLRVFPNPAYDFISIDAADYQKLEILDILGRVVLEKKDFAAQIDILNLSEGNYRIRITLNNKVYSGKFIKFNN